MALSGAAAIAAAQGTAPGTEPRTPGEEKALNLCSTCHGPRGISTSPEFPILAAQRAGYLESQLEAFRPRPARKIAHDFMWGIAYNLDDAMIKSVALYYSMQPPTPGRPGDPAQVTKARNCTTRESPTAAFPRASATAPTRRALRRSRVLPGNMQNTY
jgi:cytochrome c553